MFAVQIPLGYLDVQICPLITSIPIWFDFYVVPHCVFHVSSYCIFHVPELVVCIYFIKAKPTAFHNDIPMLFFSIYKFLLRIINRCVNKIAYTLIKLKKIDLSLFQTVTQLLYFNIMKCKFFIIYIMLQWKNVNLFK